MPTLKIQPLADRIVLKPFKAEEKTKSGLIIPDNARERPQRGKVIYTGPGRKGDPMTVKTGNTVMFGKQAGIEILFENEEYLIIREPDVVAILDEER